jgi:pseudouridine kinase
MKPSSAERFALDVLCIGGINLDRKLKAQHQLRPASSNMCIATESPGGVARNVVENLARLGMRVGLCGHVGSDAAGRELLQGLSELGVNTDACLVAAQGHTGSYTAVLDTQGQLRLGMADMALTEQLTPALLAQAGLPSPAALRLADMNLPAESLVWLAQQASLQATPHRLMLIAVSEPKMNRLPQDLRGVDTLVLNQGELVALGTQRGWAAQISANAHAAFALLQASGLQRLVVTQGNAGVVCVDAAQGAVPLKAPVVQAARVRDVSGAGDAFCAGLCASFLRYPAQTLAQHAERAMGMAVLTVQSPHTVSPAITSDLI